MNKVFYVLLIILSTSICLNTQAKKKKNVTQTENNTGTRQEVVMNYRYWDKQAESHRGYKGFPENSFLAIEEAIMQGFQIIECDVAFSKDSVPVLSHDPKVDRCSTAKGLVSNYTVEDLSVMDFGIKTDKKFAGTGITTLKEALLLCRRNNVIIELDCANKERFPNSNYHIVYNLVKKYGMLGSTIFCDTAENLKTLLDIDPNVIVSIHCIGLNDVEKGMEVARRARFADFSFRQNLITQKIINYVHEQGFYVKIWTVDNLIDFKRFTNMGVDHITTNQLGPKFDFRIFIAKPED